jgi:hypothetical protein
MARSWIRSPTRSPPMSRSMMRADKRGSASTGRRPPDRRHFQCAARQMHKVPRLAMMAEVVVVHTGGAMTEFATRTELSRASIRTRIGKTLARTPGVGQFRNRNALSIQHAHRSVDFAPVRGKLGANERIIERPPTPRRESTPSPHAATPPYKTRPRRSPARPPTPRHRPKEPPVGSARAVRPRTR